MFKVLLRFSLLLILCCLLVYAPEILCSVSAPYKLATPQRVLLRIALQGSTETYGVLHRIIHDYQKQYPHVHLRVTHMGEDLLSNTSAPYPDVVLCSPALAAHLPPDYVPSAALSLPHDGSPLCCAVASPCANAQTAAGFAAYIYEALSVQGAPAEI